MKILKLEKKYATNKRIIYRLTEKYSETSLEYYKDEFQKLKDINYIASDCKFDDDKWKINKNIEGNIIFIQDEVALHRLAREYMVDSEYFNNALKAYLVNRIASYSYSDVQKKCSLLKKLVLEEDLTVISHLQVKEMKDFLSFLNIEEFRDEYIINAEESSSDKEHETRELTSFYSVFKFDDIINQFLGMINNKFIEEKIVVKYYPIIIWWKLASTLALRPSEFLNIERNCIEEEKKNNKLIYKITLKRSLSKKGKVIILNKDGEEKYYYDDIVVIDKGTYDLIKNYLEYTNKYSSEKYLLSKKMYKDCLNYKIENIINIEKVVYYEFGRLLQCFYQDVIADLFDIKDILNRKEKEGLLSKNQIERIVPYDARHLAIINAIYMGYDIHYVQKLAAHEDIDTTYGYYKHAKEYAKSFAIAFAEDIKMSKTSNKDIKKLKLKSIYSKNIYDEYIMGKDYMQTISSHIRIDVQGCKGTCTFDFKRGNSPCLSLLLNHKKCPYFEEDNYEVAILESEKLLDKQLTIIKQYVFNRNRMFDFQERLSIAEEKFTGQLLELSNIIYKKNREG